MNKLKINSLIALALCLGLFSCGDKFLETQSMTNLTDANFYKTVADAEMALIGCYDGLQRTSSNGNLAFPVVSEVLSDNCFGGVGTGDNRIYQILDRFDPSQDPSQNDMFNGTWSDYYAGIFRCNTLLQKMDGIDFSKDEAARPRIEGETRFLRAVMYFDMVRLFERIPLLTEPTTDNLPQADPTDVYKLIVEDLKFAADSIPANAYPKAQAATNDGRVTPYAAKSLLARVYLFYTGYYGKDDLGVSKAEVLQGLEDVISSGEFGLIGDYKTLWPAACYIPDAATNTLDKSAFAGMGNIETVFSIKFNNTSNYNGMTDGNRWLIMLGMRTYGTMYWSPYGGGWGACTVNPTLVNAFETGDLRKTASIIDYAGEGIDKSPLFPAALKDWREYTGYTNKKYTPTALPDGTDDVGGTKDGQLSQDQDYVIMRYADVLLMAAEMGSPNAQSYFDQVRARAGLASKPVTFANIMDERRFEFAFEGIRYWDLLRQGLDVTASTIAQTQSVLSGNASDQVVISADNIKKTRGFMQIPNTQITLSHGVLTQNSGW